MNHLDQFALVLCLFAEVLVIQYPALPHEDADPQEVECCACQEDQEDLDLEDKKDRKEYLKIFKKSFKLEHFTIPLICIDT